MTIHDLQNVHFLPYMDMALTFRPSQWISRSLPSESAVSLDLGLSIYGIFRGCPTHIFSKTTNSLQTMEMHGNFHPPSPQKWLVREYNSHGLEYFLGPNEVHKWVFSKGR